MIKTIYNSDTYEVYNDNDIEEMLIENGINKEDITEDDILEERIFLSDIDFQSIYDNLNKATNKLIVIANLGLWHGKRQGYKLLDENNLQAVFDVVQGDYFHLYYDGFNLKATDAHHDGTNHYVFRELKEDTNYDVLLEKLYQGVATSKDINRYTRSLRPYVKTIFNW